MAAGRGAIIEDTLRSGGSGSIQLIEPGAGGAPGQIARPGESAAPNYAGMFAEATKAALEPAKFMWGMYKDKEELAKQQQELMLKGQELDETKRSNLIKEQQAAATAEIDRMREAETERHNVADETRLQAQEDREKAADEWKKTYYGAMQGHLEAEQSEIQLKVDDAKQYSQWRKDDFAAIDDLKKKIGDYGSTDWYSIQDHPELADKIKEVTGNLRTQEGREYMKNYTGQNIVAGQEAQRQQDMLDWDRESRDQFIKKYNDPNPNLTATQRFDEAFNAGSQVQERIMAKRGYTGLDKSGKPYTVTGWSPEAYKAEQDFKNANAGKLPPDELDRESFSAGQRVQDIQEAELTRRGMAGVKAPTSPLKLDDIQKTVGAYFSKATAEEQARISNEAWAAEQKQSGGAAEVFDKELKAQGAQAPKPAAQQGFSWIGARSEDQGAGAEWLKKYGKLGNAPPAQPVFSWVGERAPAPASVTPQNAPSGLSRVPAGATTTPSPGELSTSSSPAPLPSVLPGTNAQANLPTRNMTAWDYWSSMFNPPEETATA